MVTVKAGGIEYSHGSDLRVLAALGFLKNDKKGREVYYRINDSKFIALVRDLKKNPIFKELLLKALEDEK